MNDKNLEELRAEHWSAKMAADVVSLSVYREVLTERVLLEQELERTRRDLANLRENLSPEAVEKLKTLVLKVRDRLTNTSPMSAAIGGALRMIEEHIKGEG